jgi:hypothetical protein
MTSQISGVRSLFKKLIVSLIFISSVLCLKAQSPTPLAIPVAGCTFTNYTDNSTHNPPTPDLYNCHAFAWYSQEKATGQPWPISISPTDNYGAPQIYWNSGYYAEITESSEATRICYSTTSSPNYYPVHSAIRVYPN